MSTREMTLFFVLLAGAGFVVLVAALAAVVVRLVTGSSPAFVETVRPYALPIAFVAAAASMLGSLYYSEIAGFDPCHKCWQQRYMMYPAAVLLGLALIARRTVAARIAVGISLVLAVVGIGISTMHRLEQQFPDDIGGSCSLDNPCSGRYVNQFDFVTIPTMAWVGFALVIVFATLSLVSTRNADAQAAN